MNKLKYICTSAIRNVCRFKLTSLIRVLSIFICLMITSIILSLHYGTNEYINGSMRFKNINDLNLYVADSPDNDLNFPVNECQYEFQANQKRIVYKGAYLGGISLSIISDNYSDIYNDFFAEGRFMDNDNECIIGEKLSEKYKINVGDKLTIGNKELVISGITNISRFAFKILVCNEEVIKVGYPKFYFFSDRSNLINIKKEHIYSHDKVCDYFTDFLNNSSIIMICSACLIVLLYSLMSITNIYKFYIERIHITNFIQFAVGAKKNDIILQSLIENIIISFIAAFFSFVSAKMILNPLMRLASFYLYLPLRSFAVIILFALIISIILALTNIRLNRRIIIKED